MFALLLAAETTDEITVCSSGDFTDPQNYSTVTLLNDTSATILVDDCPGDYCTPDQPVARLTPTAKVNVNAACRPSRKYSTSWRLTTTNGNTVGFIAVDTSRKHDGLVYPVSAATADRTTAARPNP